MSEHGHLFDEVKRLIASGKSKKDLFDAIKAMTSDPKTEPVAGKLRGYAARLWMEAEFEEKSWTGVSTNDRIDKAFEFLDGAGIFTAQDFWCCSSCGHSAAWDAMTERKNRGYVFYHQQDTERGVAGGGLMLAYGSSGDGDDDVRKALGREICSALDRFGIPYEWNGSPDVRISIEPFEWRKRRVTTAPPIPVGERGKVIPRKTEEGESGGEVSEAKAPKVPEPDARLTHADGRVWEGTMGDRQLVFRIRDTEGDEFSRVVQCADPRAELDSRIAELRADGFT
jgi:hypothetical protein